MLYYKAWCESRTRSLIGLGVIVALCTVIILFHELLRSRAVTSHGIMPYSEFVYLRSKPT